LYEPFVDDRFPGEVLAHEGFHLWDPPQIEDDSSNGQVNNAYALTGFVAELTGMPFDRARNERGAGI